MKLSASLVQHQRLPELEMLEILDRLIDLLRAAHDLDIVYNDVDAKHLFWNRERYELKVIDWGNAVFLEGDEATLAGISRQTDIYQIGRVDLFHLVRRLSHRSPARCRRRFPRRLPPGQRRPSTPACKRSSPAPSIPICVIATPHSANSMPTCCVIAVRWSKTGNSIVARAIDKLRASQI